MVPVYGLGTNGQGRPFYAMRFIRGESLKEAIDRFPRVQGRLAASRRLALRQLLSRFVGVCNTMAYAHSRGVLHRDLKPSNIMLGPYGETLVVDWGLAKVVGRDDPYREPSAEATLRPGSRSGSSETEAGTVIGTPAYMSPEQAEGRLESLGPASDVYSLGATLYCLLTGRPPFVEPEVFVVLRKVQRGDFRPPRQVAHQVPPALEAVVLKAMAPAPEGPVRLGQGTGPGGRAMAGGRAGLRLSASRRPTAWSDGPGITSRRWPPWPSWSLPRWPPWRSTIR